MAVRDIDSAFSDAVVRPSFAEGVPGRRGGYSIRVKPTLDRILGLILLALSSPVIAGAAIALWVRNGRPIFFTQERIGKNGTPFRLYKLRTMAADQRESDIPFVGEDRRKVHKSPDDPRVGRLGYKIRALRLDELPQFWNVVKGDMSLVGPRPELPAIVAQYDEWQHSRHLVKPGVTGLWQVSEANGKLMHECTEIDLEYIEWITFRQDLAILVRTPFAMLGRRGF